MTDEVFWVVELHQRDVSLGGTIRTLCGLCLYLLCLLGKLQLAGLKAVEA